MRRLSTLLKLTAITAFLLLAVGQFSERPPAAQAIGVYASNPVPGNPGVLNPILTAQNATSGNVSSLVITDGDPFGPGSFLRVLLTGSPSTSIDNTTNFSLKFYNAASIEYNPVPTEVDVTTTGSLRVDVICNTSTAGTFNGTLTVVHSSGAGNQTAQYTVTCTVNAPVYNSTPGIGQITLNTTDIAAPVTTNIVVRNDGLAPSQLVVTSAVFDTVVPAVPELTVISGGGGLAPIDAGTSSGTPITIQCNPAGKVQNFSNNLSVFHNGAGSPARYTVTCVSVGTAQYDLNYKGVAVPDTGGVIVFDPINVGLVSTAQLQIVNPGNALLTATLSESSVNFHIPPPSIATNPPNSTSSRMINIASKNNAIVEVECRPSAVSLFETTLTINQNEGGIPKDVTYTLRCTGLTAAGIYSSNPPANSPNPLNLGTVAVGTTTAVQNIAITNIGTGPLNIIPPTPPAIALSGTNVGDFIVTGLANILLNPGQSTNLGVSCSPSAEGTRTATLSVNYNDGNTGFTAAYLLSCIGGVVVPTNTTNPALSFSSNPAAGGTISIPVGQTRPLTINNGAVSGGPNLSIASAVFSGGTSSAFSFSPTPTFPIAVAPQGSTTLSITCTSSGATTGLTVTHNASGTTATYTVNCTAAGLPAYTSSPTAGSTISINVPIGSSATSTLTISETGSATLAGNLIFSNPTDTQFTLSATSFSIADGGSSVSVVITCRPSSTTAGSTITNTLNVTTVGAGGPYTYIVNCVVINATATPVGGVTSTPAGTATSTAAAAVSATSVTSCPENQVLSSPFPQNAAGEFLLVNCYIVNTAGTVNVSLSQILTNTGSSVGEGDVTTIQSNAGLMSVWRMGSWFLVPSEYNPATQTYTFQSASGTNIYVFFYGGITEPIGSQSTTFAGTTTGNVEDVTLSEDNPLPLAAILSTLLVGFVVIVGISRRFSQNAAKDESPAS